jgi:hypothetical protein
MPPLARVAAITDRDSVSTYKQTPQEIKDYHNKRGIYIILLPKSVALIDALVHYNNQLLNVYYYFKFYSAIQYMHEKIIIK